MRRHGVWACWGSGRIFTFPAVVGLFIFGSGCCAPPLALPGAKSQNLLTESKDSINPSFRQLLIQSLFRKYCFCCHSLTQLSQPLCFVARTQLFGLPSLAPLVRSTHPPLSFRSPHPRGNPQRPKGGLPSTFSHKGRRQVTLGVFFLPCVKSIWNIGPSSGRPLTP